MKRNNNEAVSLYEINNYFIDKSYDINNILDNDKIFSCEIITSFKDFSGDNIKFWFEYNKRTGVIEVSDIGNTLGNVALSKYQILMINRILAVRECYLDDENICKKSKHQDVDVMLSIYLQAIIEINSLLYNLS